MDRLDRLEEILGCKFNNKDLYLQALTHSSYANEIGQPRVDNERLEFLGDAVLDMVVSNILFNSEIDKAEGVLTKLRASVVCEKSLARVSRDMGLNELIRLGKGEEQNGGRYRDSLIADCVEAIIGATYIDLGYTAAFGLVERMFATEIKEAEDGNLLRDYKTDLQELLQSRGPCDIEYVEVKEEGPDHDKSFTFSVKLNGEVIGTGSGKSKKAAQIKAAEAALRGINGI